MYSFSNNVKLCLFCSCLLSSELSSSVLLLNGIVILGKYLRDVMISLSQ